MVPDVGRQRITTRWVCTENRLDDGSTKAKATLVAHGFEEEDTAGPTVGRSVWRVLVLAAIKRWKPFVWISRQRSYKGIPSQDMFICNLQKELGTDGKLMKLHKSDDSPLQWYKALGEKSQGIGGIVCKCKPCLWAWFSEGLSVRRLIAKACAHVDNIFLAGALLFVEALLDGHIVILVAKY